VIEYSLATPAIGGAKPGDGSVIECTIHCLNGQILKLLERRERQRARRERRRCQASILNC
jgi:hypothetical protein